MNEQDVVRKAQERLSDPVLGAALVNRTGTLDAIITSTMLDIATGGHGATAVPDDEAQQDEGPPVRLPLAFMLAVTAHHLHVFAIAMAFGRLRVKDELARFDREGMVVVADQGPITTVFQVVRRGRRHAMAFEIVTSDYAREFAQVLGAPVRGATAEDYAGAQGRRDRRWIWKWLSRLLVSLLVLWFVAGAAYSVWYFFHGSGPGS